MAKLKLFLLSLLLFVCCSNSQFSKMSMDFSGMDEFWHITSLLSKNIEPDDQDWDRLFNTTGYATLTRLEFSKKYFKNYFRLAYMPAMSDSLKQELEKTSWTVNYLIHMTKILSREKEIKDYQKKLSSSDHLIKTSLELTKDYFPVRKLPSQYTPPISFVIFGNDARGYSPVIIDILNAIEQGDNLKYLLGHEAHHFYRNKMLSFNFPDINDAVYNIIWTINQIQAEGIADQIDKRILLNSGGEQKASPQVEKYRDAVNSSPMTLKRRIPCWLSSMTNQVT